MSTKIQFRRKVIVIVLLCVAVGGAIVRHYATPGTTTRDIATLLMVLWVPIIGNVIAWLVSKRPRRAPRAAAAAAATASPSFDTAGAFTPHAQVELIFRKAALPSQDVPIAPGEYRGALVVDKEGFSARWIVPAGEALARGKPAVLDVEFLSPAMARPKLAQGADFRVLIGEAFIADGRVLQAR
jgi:hypothetical protein